MQPEISVIIVHYNTRQELDDCLRSIYEMIAGVQFEVIVVDNASSERLKLEPRERLHLICNETNVGFARACNQAARLAKGENLLFLNPDTVFQNDVLSAFLSFQKKTDSDTIACFGAHLTNSTGAQIHNGGPFPSMRTMIARKIFRSTKPVFFEGNGYVTGAALFVSQKDFWSVNGFDERFFMYFEEADLQFRLAAKGKRASVAEDAVVVHTAWAATKSNPALRRVLYRNGMMLYFRKHSSVLEFAAFWLIWNIIDPVTLLQKMFVVPAKNSTLK